LILSMASKRFLIITASTGNGHTSAANALKQEFEAQGVVAEVIDCMDHVPRTFRKWFKGGYETLVKRSPWTWGHLYRTSDRPLLNYWVQTFLDDHFSYPMDRVIARFKPDWVVCTHSIIQPRLPSLGRKVGFKTAVVVTDLYPHRMWLRGRPDYYFVPTEESKVKLTKRIHGRVPIEVTGIPVNAAFAHPPVKEHARAALQLGERPTILLSSGGIGAGPFDDATAALADLDVDVLVVCGRSKEAFARLSGKFENRPNVKLFGHLSQAEMAQAMSACDLLVGKSGGLTTFESLAVGTPFVVLWPFLIPGQEEDNARYLHEHGAGVIVKEMDDLIPTVQRLISDSSSLAAMTQAAESLARPNAAGQIVDRLIHLPIAKRGRVLLGQPK
jgi:processive 1,2-diacylglycerol beta-glucosyltransferase